MNLEVFYNGNNKILLPDRGGYRNEPFEDILFFKAISRHVEVNLINCRCYIANIAIGKLDEILPKKVFARSHRGYIINLLYVYRVDVGRDKIILEKDIVLPLSRRKKDNVLEGLKYISLNTSPVKDLEATI